ncbi:uncharacterized protein Z520_11531 [Fonsecaea multimorphosa CBS 102226]|uniref:Uncharacterized protein n=1 Tax=Fonsecaea multimorphosa CBS 102226 TaxID=1442371 RepID=A0A0D2JQA7_9EURO|nr:uncharacterized protein Z520_11531 [Fonsecaea multimorphosa CBS 102226]KIX92679.1 hypothetical protein Z520_11531 [Fonsecaea multimorphosa CBS 102226]OAL18010.1 hypothetical protein AYO22_11078 [Fonsecaea multimorphosa]
MFRTTNKRHTITLLRTTRPYRNLHMDKRPKFRFRRPLDGLAYEFHLEGGTAKESVYVRSDSAVRMIYDREFGWSIWDDPDAESASRMLLGRVWEVPVKDQGDQPPEGVWVSRKADKSYVYILEYLE